MLKTLGATLIGDHMGKKLQVLFLSMVGVLSSLNAQPKCSHVLAGDDPHFKMISSGRDGGAVEVLKEAAEILFGENGVAKQLGIAYPSHVVEFSSQRALNVLAALGRHAVPHWNDGAKLTNAGRSAGGVLEFVTPGCPHCRSYYSDTTSIIHQISGLDARRGAQ